MEETEQSVEVPVNAPESPVASGKRKTEAQLLAAAEMLRKGSTIKAALKVAGYSDRVAGKGVNGITGKLRRVVIKEGMKITEIGRSFNAQQQEEMVRGGLIMNAALSQDVKSLELLGKDKRVNMFASEAMTGVIVLQLPQTIAHNVAGSLPVMDGEIVGELPALPQTADSKD